MSKSPAQILAESYGGSSSSLDRALTRYENNQGILDRLGAVPKAGLGLLARAVAPLDYLAGIARTQAFNFANLNPANPDIDINMDGDTTNDGNPLINLKRAIFKNPFDASQRVAGFGDVDMLKWQDDDSFLTKALKGTVALAGDISTDPLTYLTVGVGPLAKKAGLRAVGTVTAEEATKALAQKGGTKVARNILKEAQASGSRNADTILSRTGKNKATAAELRRAAADEIADTATALYRRDGATSVSDYFKRLSDDTGIAEFGSLWSRQIPEVRGGFRTTGRVSTKDGPRVIQFTPGGQSPLTKKYTNLTTRIGGSRIGQALTSGAEREFTREARRFAKEGLSKNADEAASALAKQKNVERQIREAYEFRIKAAAQDRRLANKVQPLLLSFQQTARSLDDAAAGQGDEFRRLASEYYDAFGMDDGKVLFEQGVVTDTMDAAFDQAGVPRVLSPDTSDLHRRAYEHAAAAHKIMYDEYVNMKGQYGDLFSEAGVVDGPLRVMSDEADEWVKNTRGSGASQGTGNYKTRTAFRKTEEDGSPGRWFTIREANDAQRRDIADSIRRETDDQADRFERAAKKGDTTVSPPKKQLEPPEQWFETDLEKILSKTVNKQSQQARRALRLEMLLRSGAVKQVDSVGKVKNSRVYEAINEEMDRLSVEQVQNRQRVRDLLRGTGEPFETPEAVQRFLDDNTALSIINDPPLLKALKEARDEAIKTDARKAKLLEARLKDVEALNDEFAEMLSDQETLRALLQLPSETTGEESTRMFEELFDGFMNLTREQYGRVTARKGKKSAEALEIGKKMNRINDLRKLDTAPVAEVVDEGRVRLGSIKANNGKELNLIDDVADLWAAEEMAEALARSYELINGDPNAVIELLDVALRAWKQTATFGRGITFVSRNLGTWWNTYLVGGSPVDFKDGLAFTKARDKAIRRFKKEAASTENPAELIFLADELMRQEMKGKTFAGIDMYDAYRLMDEQNMFDGTLTTAAADVDAQGIPTEVTAEGIVGRGRQSVFEGTNIAAPEGRLIPEQPFTSAPTDTFEGLIRNIKELRDAGELKLGRRGLDSLVNNRYMRFMRATSENSEVLLRSSTFATGIRRFGGTYSTKTATDLANLLVKATQFDYADLSRFEQRFVKRMAPFFIWTKNNVPLQFRNLFANPGKVNAALRSLDTAQDILEGDEDEAGLINQYLPSWVQEQLGRTGQGPLGQKYAYALNLPLADLNRFVTVPDSTNPLEIARDTAGTLIGGGRDDVVGAANPFVKAAFESATGVNTFTGAKFTDTTPAGPLYGLIPGTSYIDPETGQRNASSGFAQTQFRNLLPQAGLLERLVPFRQQGNNQDRLVLNWLQQTGILALPVAPIATLNESQIAGELRSRNRDLEDVIKKEARKLGMTSTELREQFNTDKKMNRLFGTGRSSSSVLANTMSLAERNRQRALAAALAPG